MASLADANTTVGSPLVIINYGNHEALDLFITHKN